MKTEAFPEPYDRARHGLSGQRIEGRHTKSKFVTKILDTKIRRSFFSSSNSHKIEGFVAQNLYFCLNKTSLVPLLRSPLQYSMSHDILSPKKSVSGYWLRVSFKKPVDHQ